MNFTVSPSLNTFWKSSVVILTNVALGDYDLKKCQHLEDMYNSGANILQMASAWCLQNHVWGKDPFKVCDKPMGFNITGNKMFIDTISDFILLGTY